MHDLNDTHKQNHVESFDSDNMICTGKKWNSLKARGEVVALWTWSRKWCLLLLCSEGCSDTERVPPSAVGTLKSHFNWISWLRGEVTCVNTPNDFDQGGIMIKDFCSCHAVQHLWTEPNHTKYLKRKPWGRTTTHMMIRQTFWRSQQKWPLKLAHQNLVHIIKWCRLAMRPFILTTSIHFRINKHNMLVS